MELEPHLISKSTYMMGQQCPKRLWLYKNRPELKRDTNPSQQSVFERGVDIGVLARELFPDGKDMTPKDHFQYQDAVKETQLLIDSGVQVIYEAAFQFDGVLAVLDILVKGEKGWYAYEVKSSSEVKDYFLKDAALQYYVMVNSGIKIKDIFIVHINNQYVRSKTLDIKSLFYSVSVKQKILELQKSICSNIVSSPEVRPLEVRVSNKNDC